MKNFSFKKILPYVVAILIFVVITFLYFSPLLEGKKLLQSDIVHFKGMSKEIVDYREKTGQEPLWTNSMFGGMPAYQISTNYSSNVLSYLDRALSLGLPHPANLVFLYFLGFFILLLVMGVNPWLSIVGAIAFGMSSYFFIILEAGHNSKAHAIAYMAPVIAGIILTLRKKYLWGGILTAIFLSLEIRANHPQITYYLAMIAVLLGVFKLIHAFRFKELMPFTLSVGVLVLAAVLAILTNITSLWATMEYGKYTIRGKSELTSEQHNRTSGLDKDYATQWSYGVGETMTLLIPDVYGGSSSIKVSPRSKIAESMKANGIPEESVQQFISQPLPFMYWGSQPFTSGPVYVGAIIVFLFVLGLIIVKGPIKWWLLAATVLSILLAWGHNFMAFTDFFLDYIPGYNKFRAVTMILVIAEFAMPLLGILALRELFTREQDVKKLFRGGKIALAITGGICLLFILIPGLFLNFNGIQDTMFKQQYQFPEWLMQGIRDERARVVRLDALRSLVLILFTSGILWAVLSNKLKAGYAYLILGLLIVTDLFMVNKRYFGNDSFTTSTRVENPYEPSAADQSILADPSLDYRVLNLIQDPFNDASVSYFHKSIGGYHGAKLRRYQEIIDHGIEPEIRVIARSMSTDSLPVINMLNTKYFILPGSDKQPIAYPNPDALGNAWFVKNYKVVENADAEIAAIRDFRPDSLAVIHKEFAGHLKNFTPATDSTDRISLDEYAPNRLKYSYSLKKQGLVVFSEIYYPKGWTAYLDGQATPHFRADYVLRAMVLPEGTHKVEFRFEPAVYYTGEKISLISSVALVVLVLAAAGYEIIRRKRSGA